MMAYRWEDGLPIKVVTGAAGVPIRFKLGSTWYTVEHVVDRWRVDEGWWEERVWREYFQLITTSGQLVTLQRSLTLR
jgi:hypothetical protein